MRDWNWKIYQMVRKFSSFCSEWKKRSAFEGTPQFPNGIFGKLPYHLTSNRNFRIFWLNGPIVIYFSVGCQPRSQSFVPLDQRSENEGSGRALVDALVGLWLELWELLSLLPRRER